jgi:hypothetical protein
MTNQILLIYVIYVVIAACVTVLAVKILSRLLRVWRTRARIWATVIGLSFIILLSAIVAIKYGEASVYIAFLTPDPGPHACGGPYVEGAGPCEAALWDAWAEAGHEAWARFGNRYMLWLMLPPMLRPPCDRVDADVCQINERFPDPMGTDAEYAAGLAPLLISAAFNGWIARRILTTRHKLKIKRKRADEI